MLLVAVERAAQRGGTVRAGRGNAESAAGLVISPLTVTTHLNRRVAELHAHDRAQLVIAGYESGLLRPGEG